MENVLGLFRKPEMSQYRGFPLHTAHAGWGLKGNALLSYGEDSQRTRLLGETQRPGCSVLARIEPSKTPGVCCDRSVQKQEPE